MEININVNLSGDPELITTLATLVQCIQGVLHISNSQMVSADTCTQPDPEVVQDSPKVVQTEPEVVQNKPETVPNPPVVAQAPAATVAPPVPTAPAKNYTWAEIQTACAPLIDNGASQQALMALLPKYGVQSLMNIPQARYGELVIDLRALGAKL